MSERPVRYRAVLFDVGETLVTSRESFGATYARVFRGLGVDVPVERFEEAIRWTLTEMQRSIPPGADRYAVHDGGEEAYWLRFGTLSLSRADGREAEPTLVRQGVDELRRIYATAEAWHVYPDATPVLENLRSIGVRLGVVSNWDSRLPRVLELLDLARYFDEVGVSHLEGVEKPAALFFQRVLSRLDVPADRALHIGDIPEMDLAGARAAGIDALLIDRKGRQDASHLTIPDLSTLPDIVRRGLDCEI